MKNLKKVLALVIAFTMLLGFGVSASVFPDVADDASYAEAVTILSGMGIMIGDDQGNFRPDDTITRAEATAIVVRAKGLDEAAAGAKGATAFSDVAADHWATGYINLASQNGIVNGFTDGTFRPEDPVAYEQIVKMIVAALGYEPKAQLNGGYPTGYLVIAAQEKINSGATGSAGQPAKRSVVGRLTFNALTVNMMDVSEYGSDVTYAVTNKTLLNDYLDTYVVEATVIGTPLTDGNGDPDFDEVTFDKLTNNNKGKLLPDLTATIHQNKVDASDYLGQYVTAYISENEDGDYEIVGIAGKTGKNIKLSLDYSQLESFDGATIVEYTPQGSTKTDDIELSGTVVYFYNGRTDAASITKAIAFLTQATVKPGKVEFVDNDNDSVYDIVFVTEYGNSYVVKEVTANKIIDKDENTVPKIDTKNEDLIVKFFKDGNAIELADIAADDVVTTAISTDGKLVNVYVSSNKVEGAVTEKDTSEASDPSYTIGGKEYRIATGNGPAVEIGDEGTFYLNVDNRIAYKDATSSSGNYAYLYAAHLTSGINGNVVEVKFINTKGEWITADVAKKVKVYKVTAGKYEGKALADAAAANVDAGIYTVSADGKTATPNTAAPVFKYTTNSAGEISAIYLKDTKKVDDTFSLDASTNGTKKEYKAADLRIGSTYFAEDTVIFSVPATGILTDEDDITVTTVGAMLQDETDYDFDAYDIKDGYPSLVVIKGESTKIDDATRVLVINSIADTKNSEDEDVKRIAGLQSGQSVSGLTKTTVEVTLADGTAGTIDDVAKGDVVIFSLNSKGEIDKVKVLMAYADAKAMITKSKAGAAGGFKFNSDDSGNYNVTDIFGFAAKKESGNKLNITKIFVDNSNLVDANLVDASEGKLVMYRASAPANFYKINTERSTVAATAIDYSDVEVEISRSTASYKTEGTWVYVREIDGVVTDVVAYTANNPL